jgi:hypothetical protein
MATVAFLELIEHEDMTNKISELTRGLSVKKQQQAIITKLEEK